MAKNKTELVIKRHQLWVKKLVRKHRLNMFHSLARSLDEIRLASVAEIRPNTVGKNKSPYRMAKEQPSIPGKLTERTGRLIKMLKAKGQWKFKERTYTSKGFKYTAAKTATFKSPYIKGNIKVNEGFNTDSETFVATLRASVDSGTALEGYEVGTRIVRTLEGETQRVRNKVTRQQLAMRFKHETGIRGQRRPFVEPAAKKHGFTTVNVIRAKLSELGSV